MSLRTPVALLAGLLLFAGACDDNGEEQEDVGAEVDQTSPEDGPDADPVQLEDGIAGIVDGEEITDDEVDEGAQQLASHPQFAAQIEQGQISEELLPSLALQEAIQTHVLEVQAAELGVEADEAAIAAAEEDLVEEMGGREQLDEQLEQTGLGEEDLRETLRFEVLIDGVAEHLEAEGEVDEQDAMMGPDGQEIDPGQQAVQQWLIEQMSAADIQVDEQYGVWVEEQGTLMPPEEHMPEQPPMEGPEGMAPEGEGEEIDPEELEELMEEMGEQ